MNVVEYVNKDSGRKKAYEYYKKLGYGEKASLVLASLTYGERFVNQLAKKFDRENRLDRIYDWLTERPEESVMEAVRNEFMKFDKPERGLGLPGFLGNLGMSSKMAAKPAMAAGVPVMMEECMVEKMAPEPMPAPGGVMMAMAEPLAPGGANLMELTATDSYEPIEEKDAKNVITSPTSTFRMTTTTSSMGVLLNQVRSGRRIDMSQVRIEEVLNYFDYDHGAWTEKDAKFRISTEQIQKSEEKQLLYINVEAANEKKDHQNVILLLDVSGSMSSQNEVTQEAIATIIGKLHEGDVLSLVTYSSVDENVFENHVIAGIGDKEDLMGRILELEITGCTNGSAGIETAYALGKKTYQKDWSNQVILITDGDLNFGITKKDGLKDLIEEKKKTGLFLSVIGTGLYNYKDDKLEVLSKHGNGTYCVVNNLDDIECCVNKRYVSLTNVIAKDVKAQVEFNPKYVKTYRLLGYENRALAHEDFTNDKVISEPYGSGGHGVALYELEMGDATASQGLKYQQAVAIPSEELCTVKVRFKEPLGEESIEVSKAVMQSGEGAGNARFAYFLYCLSEKLRKSDKLDDADEAFFEEMRKSGAYKEAAGENAFEIELLLKEV